MVFRAVYDVDHIKNDGSVSKLEKERFFNVTSDQCELNEIASLFLNLTTI